MHKSELIYIKLKIFEIKYQPMYLWFKLAFEF